MTVNQTGKAIPGSLQPEPSRGELWPFPNSRQQINGEIHSNGVLDEFPGSHHEKNLDAVLFVAQKVTASQHVFEKSEKTSVTYRYTPSGTKSALTRTVDGWKFVRGFLQHALPKGFRKVRYYGWMASNSRTKLDRVKWLVWLYLGWTFWLGSRVAPQPERHQNRIRCKDCGGVLRVIGMTNAEGRIICCVLPDHATQYLDSG